MNFSSRLIEDAVKEMSGLPGIGKKTALRLVLHLLKKEEQSTLRLTEALRKLRREICYCSRCHNISDESLCGICKDPSRNQQQLCVVENAQDIMAIENTMQYKGIYHVLGGVIAPVEGVSPSDLNIESLIKRVETSPPSEVIFALSPTMDGDTTAFYLTKKLKEFPVKITTIARGIPIGSELEYADEVTLGRSILTRIAYE